MAKRNEPLPPQRPTSNQFDWPAQQTGSSSPANVPPGQAAPGAPQQGMPPQQFGQPIGQGFGQPPTQQLRQPAYRYAPPQRSMSTGAKVAIGISIAIAGLLVMAILAAFAIPVFLNQRAKAVSGRIANESGLTPAQLAAAPYCGVAPTPTMPTDTRAYVDALVVLNHDHDAFSRTVGAAGGSVSTQDLEGFIASDEAFVRTITSIPWSSQARDAHARSTVAAIQRYDQALSSTVPGKSTRTYDPAEAESSLSARLAATRDLRSSLGLPSGTCPFIWPK